MQAKRTGEVEKAGTPDEFVRYTTSRARPALFLFLPQSMRYEHVFSVRRALEGKRFDELDLVIHSGGGDIQAAYQIAKLLRIHAKKVIACVPLFAKSAATLLCIGADEIILDDVAELGPLDTQVFEQKRGGKGEFTSALNPFKALEQLQKFSLETLDLTVKMIQRRSGMDLDECLKHATEFVRVTTEPLFKQLDPVKLGEYSRALSVGKEYGNRLLSRFLGWDEDKRTLVLDRLVLGYPSHDYIIDYHELRDMGFQARLFDEKEREAVGDLIQLILQEKTVIDCVSPPERQALGVG